MAGYVGADRTCGVVVTACRRPSQRAECRAGICRVDTPHSKLCTHFFCPGLAVVEWFPSDWEAAYGCVKLYAFSLFLFLCVFVCVCVCVCFVCVCV